MQGIAVGELRLTGGLGIGKITKFSMREYPGEHARAELVGIAEMQGAARRNFPDRSRIARWNCMPRERSGRFTAGSCSGHNRRRKTVIASFVWSLAAEVCGWIWRRKSGRFRIYP